MILRWLVLAFFLAAATPAFQTPSFAAECAAAKFITTAGKAMMGAARSRSPSVFAGVAGRYADLGSIAMFALGQHRAKLPAGRKGEYVALTKAFIGRFMAEHASKFNGTGIKITECGGKGDTLTVVARLTGGQRVTFRLHYSGKGYIVRDLNVSGVWLAQQLRSKFVGVISRNNGDVGALLKYLRT